VAVSLVAAMVLAGCASADTSATAASTASEGSPMTNPTDDRNATPPADPVTPTPRASTTSPGPDASNAPSGMPPADIFPTARPSAGSLVTAELQPVVDAAIADLEGRVGDGDQAFDVLVARSETFPTGALGCPQDGEVYTQAEVDGFRVVLYRDERVWLYTAAGDGEPRLCPSDQKDAGFDFVPPPGFDE